MKKVIKLTESDLTRIINKVISEQSNPKKESVGPFHIMVSIDTKNPLKTKELKVDIIAKYDTQLDGCVFVGKLPFVDQKFHKNQEIGFIFKCLNPTKLIMQDQGQTATISEKAGKLLRESCCGKYVQGRGTDIGSNYV